MAKIDLNTVSSGYLSQAALNANFTAIEDEFQDKVLYRDNPSGEPNSMQTHLDMNGFNILNAGNAAEIGLVDADDVSFIPSGTNAVSRSVGNKLRDTVVSVKDFGAVGDGVTDDTAAIQAAINSLTVGGTIYIPRGIYKVSSTLNITVGNVMLAGDGLADSMYSTSGSVAFGTVIKWAGIAGGEIIRFASPEGASAKKKTGGGLSNMTLDGGSTVAGNAIRITTWDCGTIERVFVIECSGAALKMDCCATLADERNNQQWRVSQFCGRSITNNGSFINLSGSADFAANTSMNWFEQCDFVSNNGDAFILQNCDNNFFMRCRNFRAGGGTGRDVLMNGSNANANDVARDNIFMFFSGTPTTGLITIRGTTTFTYPTLRNSMLYNDIGNATVTPTVETGAVFRYSDDRMIHGPGFSYTQAIFAETAGQAAGAYGISGISSTESARFINGSNDNVRFYNPNTGAGHKAYVDATTGDLQFTRLSGSGRFYIAQNVVLGAAASGLAFFNAAGTGKQSVTGSRGGNAALASLLTILANHGLITDSSTA